MWLHFFSLFFTGENSSLEKTVTVPPSPFDPLAEQTALVDGVQKYTEYHITVLCFTSPGDGPPSAPVVIRTAEDRKFFFLLLRSISISMPSVSLFVNYLSITFVNICKCLRVLRVGRFSNMLFYFYFLSSIIAFKTS